MLEWQAERSYGSYMKTCNKMLSRLVSGTDILNLNLQPRRNTPLPEDHPAALLDKKIIQLHWDFLCDLVANRCWSQTMWTMLPPFHFSLMFLKDREGLDWARKTMRRIATALKLLEDHVKNNPANAFTRALLTDVATHHWVITREFWSICRECDFRLDNQELRELGFACFAGSVETAYTMESCFNHAKDSIRQTKSGRMGVHCKWSYMCFNPYLKKAGLDQIKVSKDDFSTFASNPSLHNDVMSSQPFTSIKAPMPSEIPNKHDLTTKWRPAGSESNRISSAAVGLTLKQAPADFASVGKAWMGSQTATTGVL